MKQYGLAVLLAGIGFACALQAQSLTPELMQDTRASLKKGLTWLATQQQPDGSWSDQQMPALTALPLWAFAASGEKEFAPQIDKAIAFLLSKQQPDGGIYVNIPDRKGSGLGNYNTSICAAALYATGRREVMPAILKARDYIASSQHIGDDWHAGGFGYDKNSGRRYTDLNNTHFSLDAMRRTQGAEEFRPANEKKVDINWEAALNYVSQLQNTEGETAGGFAYNTQDPKGGLTTNASGRVMLRAYGSMSYAGLLALVHAQLDKTDPRVRSAVAYGSRFWTLDENPGQGQQGLYFYYNIIARALSAAGLDTLPKQASAEEIHWREEILRKVISLQKSDGSWVNDNNRWWENNPVLATSYSMLSLAFASGLTR